MADLLSLAVPNLTPSEPQTASGTPHGFDRLPPDQIVLKLELTRSSAAPEITVTPSVLTAFQALVNVINQLRTPTGGWTEAQLPTPETLAPYIQDEVQELIEALHASSAVHPSLLKQPTRAEPRLTQQRFLWLRNITDWLLWGIARSSSEIMQLLEGCPASCWLDSESQTGILRLVPLLELNTPAVSYRFDLATDRLDLALLPAAADLQLDWRTPRSQTRSQTLSSAELLGLLSEQSQSTTPMIATFLQGMSIEVLIPQYPWQPGTLQLRFGLEFTPGSPVQAAPSPGIRFTDADWLAHYSETIVQHRLMDDLAGIDWQHYQQPAALETTLTTIAWNAADALHTDLTIASRHLPHQLSLQELTARLHWCLLHSAYEIMQLMSGVPAQLLQPQAKAQSGILRLTFLLQVQTPAQEWTIDLVTGCSLATESLLTASTAVVQSAECPWCESLSLLEQLEKQVWQAINAQMPELWTLMQGTAVDVQEEDTHLDADPLWQAGILRLQSGFQFIPCMLL